jgi:hypothetical protein
MVYGSMSRAVVKSMPDSMAEKLLAALLIALAAIGSLFLVYSSEQGSPLQPPSPAAYEQGNQ